MGGGAWPFLVRGFICLVDSDNERDQVRNLKPFPSFTFHGFEGGFLYRFRDRRSH
jgi:hypothetical protein